MVLGRKMRGKIVLHLNVYFFIFSFLALMLLESKVIGGNRHPDTIPMVLCTWVI